MHRWFYDVAVALEELGITRKTIVQDLGDADIPITEKYIKEVVWFHFMVSMYGKTSTTELTTDELTKVERSTTEFLKKKYKIDVEWWSVENQHLEDWYGKM